MSENPEVWKTHSSELTIRRRNPESDDILSYTIEKPALVEHNILVGNDLPFLPCRKSCALAFSALFCAMDKKSPKIRSCSPQDTVWVLVEVWTDCCLYRLHGIRGPSSAKWLLDISNIFKRFLSIWGWWCVQGGHFLLSLKFPPKAWCGLRLHVLGYTLNIFWSVMELVYIFLFFTYDWKMWSRLWKKSNLKKIRKMIFTFQIQFMQVFVDF